MALHRKETVVQRSIPDEQKQKMNTSYQKIKNKQTILQELESKKDSLPMDLCFPVD